MSKVAIQGNASGTATFTIEAPVGTGTDRTLTLPDEAGTVLTSATSIPTSQIASLTQGVTEYDRWSRSNGFTLLSQYSNYFTTNWSSYGKFGTGMTESSGVFTFPSTGFWLIRLCVAGYTNAGAVGVVRGVIEITTNNSTYVDTTYSPQGKSSARWYSAYCDYLFDVTDTSTHKVKMSVYDQAGGAECYFQDGDYTNITFMRLGDT